MGSAVKVLGYAQVYFIVCINAYFLPHFESKGGKGVVGCGSRLRHVRAIQRTSIVFLY